MYLPHLTISLIFAWYDMWIGLYIDTPKQTVYIFPIPMFGLKIKYRMEKV